MTLLQPLTHRIGKAYQAESIDSETLCDFIPQAAHASDTRAEAEVLHAMDEDDNVEMVLTAASDDLLHFGRWVNQVRIRSKRQLHGAERFCP